MLLELDRNIIEYIINYYQIDMKILNKLVSFSKYVSYEIILNLHYNYMEEKHKKLDIYIENIISKCINLEQLEMQNHSINNLNFLNNCKKIYYLNLSNNIIDNIDVLYSLSNIEILYLGDIYTDNKFELNTLNNLKRNLTQLYLINIPITNLSFISECNDITKLNITRCEYLDDVSELDNLNNIIELNITRSDGNKDDADDIIIKGLPECYNIKELNISGTIFECICRLEHYTKLEKLNISFTYLREIDLPLISVLTNLTYLNIRCCEIEDISNLSSLINLEYLDLYHNPIVNLYPIENFKKLKHLDISNCCWITNLTPLKKLINLEYLDMSDEDSCNYYDSIPYNINEISNLKKLNTLKMNGKGFIKINNVNNLINLKHLEVNCTYIYSEIISKLVNLEVLSIHNLKLLKKNNNNSLHLDKDKRIIKMLLKFKNLHTIKLCNKYMPLIIKEVIDNSKFINLKNIYLYNSNNYITYCLRTDSGELVEFNNITSKEMSFNEYIIKYIKNVFSPYNFKDLKNLKNITNIYIHYNNNDNIYQIYNLKI